MLRPGLATERRVAVERSPLLRQAQAVASAEVAAASSAAVVEAAVDEKIGTAIAGDITTNPYIADKLERLDRRLNELEQIQ